MSTLFFDRPRLLVTTLALLLVGGLSAVSTIVRQEDPTITNGVAVIVTPLPGASAERVEVLVTEKIEDELRELDEIQTLSSVSRAGVSVVTVELDENILGKATERAFSKVRDRLEDARQSFPPGALAPVFDDDRFGSYTRTVSLSADERTETHLSLLGRYADELQDRFRSVPGTDTVRTFGRADEEIRVELDPTLLDQAGMTTDQVAGRLRTADAKVAAGVLRGPGKDLFVELEGELDSLFRIRSVPLATSDGSAFLRVGDVADVRRGVSDPPADVAYVDGRRAVVVAAKLGEGRRYDGWANRVDAMLAEFERMLPDGLQLSTVFDQTRYTTMRLRELVQNLLVGLALVVAVLFVTLGLRSALIVASTLPLVSLAAVGVLRVGGVPIHQMSVTGLIVALGLLVDNAIVVTDAVRAKRLRGVDGRRAVREAVEHLWVPLLSSTVTTVLAFMPILLLAGRVGEFVGTIGLSVVVSLIASYLLAMSVVPALAGRYARPSKAATGFLSTGLVWPWGRQAFERSLQWSLSRPWTSMALASVLPLLGFVGATTLSNQFFPPADRDQFNLKLRMAPATSIARTDEMARKVDEIVRAEPEVENTAWFVGRSAPPFYYNLKQDQDGNASFAQAQVQVSSPTAVRDVIHRLQRRLDEELPETQVVLEELLQGPPVDAPIELRVYGPDLRELRRIGDELRERLARVPEVIHSTATLTSGAPKLWLHADEAEARLAGLSLVSLAAQLRAQLDGTLGGSVLEDTEELPVRIRVRDAERTALPGVRSLRFQAEGAGTGSVPLETLGEVRMRPALDRIPHRQGSRVNVIRAFTQAGVFPATAAAGFEQVLADAPVELPVGYRIEAGGDQEERGEAMANLFASVPVLVLLMVATVALSLASFRLAAVVFVVAGQSAGLGLLSLTLLQHPLGFQGMIGLIGLVGVAINAAIVISSVLRAEPDAVAGSPEAIRHIVVHETSRHIVSTTITTFGGFLPLILSPGGFWPPFATAIAGGVLLSTIVSFYFVPAAFLVVTRSRQVEPDLSLAVAQEVPA